MNFYKEIINLTKLAKERFPEHHLPNEMEDIVDAKKDDIEENFLPENPVLKELRDQLSYLNRENADL